MRMYTDIEVAAIIALHQANKKLTDFDEKYDVLFLLKDTHTQLFKGVDEDVVLGCIYMAASKRSYRLPLLRPRLIKYMSAGAANLVKFSIENNLTFPPVGARRIKNWDREIDYWHTD